MTDSAIPADLESVSVCIPDHYGRLAGKRIAARRLDAVLASGMDMPDFHLSTGPDIQPAADVAVTGVHTGFPNDLLWPDMLTFRRLPWQPDCGIVLAEARRRDGSVVAEAPREILRRQAERLAGRRLTAWVATELEFYVYEGSYAQSFRQGYRDLAPLYHRNGDNDVLVTEFLEQYLRPLRQAMAGLGRRAEATQGEGGVGQAEMNFPACAPVQAADGHVLLKHAAKALAYQMSRSVTFMAKPDQAQPGSGCHLHLSLRDEDGSPCMADTDAGTSGTALSERARRFLAGVLEFSPELTLMHAPLVNSYRRLQPGDWAPSAVSWGYDNRAAMVRVVGRGPSLRMEFRLPGADANPYLAIAAVLAAGIAGLADDGIELPRALRPGGAAGAAPTGAAIPRDLTEALARFEQSKLASQAFGDAVRDHVSGMARHQLSLARQAVTDWELAQGFETA
jgi:glutamine synthetase